MNLITTLILLGALTTGSSARSSCGSAVLLAALEEADKEFVEDPNMRAVPDDPRDSIPPDFTAPGWISRDDGTYRIFSRDNRTPAKKLRDKADAEAKELERRSAVARRIRAVIRNCKGVVR